MLLKSLKLNNFRQYKGEQKINFSKDDNKNVTVILGKNTSGKTTLIQSFRWILYGKADFNTADFLLNLEIANTLKVHEQATVSGNIVLIHNDTEYNITREQSYYCGADGIVRSRQAELSIYYKSPNGQTKYIEIDDQKINTINKILPEELSKYFFFDGERISNLGENNRYGKKEMSEAVKNVLGLNVLDSAITHLSRGDKTAVVNKFKNSIDTSGDLKMKRKKTRLDSCKKNYNKNIQRIKDYTESIEYFVDEIERKEKIIKANKPTADLKREMQKNEAQININKSKREQSIKKLVKHFSQGAPMYFMQPLLHKVIDTVKAHELVDEGIPEMHAKSIDFLIKRGRCICGEKIEEENEAYKHLIKQKNYLPPKSIGVLVREFMTSAKHYNDKASDFLEDFTDKQKSIRMYKKEIQELESRNDDISENIKDAKDVGKYEEEVRELKRKLRNSRAEKERLIREQGGLESQVERLEKEINKLAAEDEKNKFIIDCIEYTDYIIEELTKHYTAMENITKRKLQKKVNEIFTKMYHGNRKIKINSRYEYDLITPDISEQFQAKADESKGLETVASFSFISGIISLAKEKIGKEMDGDLSEAYPLVMDAPFSNADEHHVEKVSKVLPEIAEQIIMFIMHKDWKYAEGVLNNNIKDIYELDKITETHTVIRREKNV